MVSFANTSTPATRVEQLVQNEATSLLADPNAATPWTNLIQRELGPSFVSQWGGTSPAAAATTPVASLFPQLAATQPVSNLDIGNFLQSLLAPQQSTQQLAGLLAPNLQGTDIGRDEADYRTVGGGKNFIDMGMGFDPSVLGTSLDDIRRNYPEVAERYRSDLENAIAFAKTPAGKMMAAYMDYSPMGFIKGQFPSDISDQAKLDELNEVNTGGGVVDTPYDENISWVGGMFDQ
jgi:hypothetical protein